MMIVFQSTLSVRRATSKKIINIFRQAISIHALREESDPLFVFTEPFYLLISIHALREESDWTTDAYQQWLNSFQSTLSVRRATVLIYIYKIKAVFQSTLSVRRATNHNCLLASKISYFNPRSPWGERPIADLYLTMTDLFQSTLSVRRATLKYYTNQKIF